MQPFDEDSLQLGQRGVVEQAPPRGRRLRGLRARDDLTVFQGLRVVLVGLDLSPACEQALTRVTLLPFAPRARLLLLHAVPPGLSEQRLEAARRQANDHLRATAARLAASFPSPNVRPEIDLLVSQGEPSVEIIRHGRSVSADVIVLGRQPRANVLGRVMPNICDQVIRRSSLPVLIVVAAAVAPYRRPVVAVDLSDSCRETVDLALRVVGHSAEQVVLVHAYSIPYETWLNDPEFKRHFHVTATKKMQELLQDYDEVDVRLVPALHNGRPEEAVFAAIASGSADLLATGHSGRSGFSRLLLGSLAEWVSRRAPCDVLIGRPVRFAFEAP